MNWGLTPILDRLRSTSFRTFILYPVLVLAWELAINDGKLRLQPWFLPLLAWGYLQYFLVGRYRIRRGGGGPGMDTPPDRLGTGGPFALCRNPMYLGHIIFLAGPALSLQSWPAAAPAARHAGRVPLSRPPRPPGPPRARGLPTPRA